jgi:hypothetical protein
MLGVSLLTAPLAAEAQGKGGVVASLARPGGNITGSAFLSEEVTAKRLDILKAALPGVARVGILVNPDNVASIGASRAFEQMAQAAEQQVRAGCQSQDRQGARRDDPTIRAGAGGSGDRVRENV